MEEGKPHAGLLSDVRWALIVDPWLPSHPATCPCATKSSNCGASSDAACQLGGRQLSVRCMAAVKSPHDCFHTLTVRRVRACSFPAQRNAFPSHQ